MGSCNGNCTGCSGCAGKLLLTDGELKILELLGQIPFLPVARKPSDMTPVYLEADAPENAGLVLQALESKCLIDIDYLHPLKGFDMTAYEGYSVHGSIALTQLGQTVVELLETQGIE